MTVEIDPRSGRPRRAPLDTPLADALRRATRKVYPEATLLPRVTVGGTDATFFRDKGGVAYGFGLFSRNVTYEDFASRFHGHDERIDVESLGLTTTAGSISAVTCSDDQPLAGRRVVVTRASDQAGALASRLAALGADVLEVPTIVVVDPDDGGRAPRRGASPRSAPRTGSWSPRRTAPSAWPTPPARSRRACRTAPGWR